MQGKLRVGGDGLLAQRLGHRQMLQHVVNPDNGHRAPVGSQRRKPALDDQAGDLLHRLRAGQLDRDPGQRTDPAADVGLGGPRGLQVARPSVDVRLGLLDPLLPVLDLTASVAVSHAVQDVGGDVFDPVQ